MYATFRTVRSVVAAIAFAALLTLAQQPGVNKGVPAAAKPAAPASKSQPAPGGNGASTDLEFLGSYSAPAAIEATETGHTSSTPPTPSTDILFEQLVRPARFDTALTAEPQAEKPADTRQALEGIRKLLAAHASSEDWFEIGSLALIIARADSRELATSSPNSPWNRRFENIALAYAGKERPSATSVCVSATESDNRPHSTKRLADTLGEAADTPAALYRRTCAAIQLSQYAFARAATSPILAARIDGLRGLAATQAGDDAAAEREYRAGLALDSNNAQLHAALGELARRGDRLTEAQQELCASLRMDPNDALTSFELADVEFRMGNIEPALSLLNQAIARVPGLLVARWTRARVLEALHQDNAAVADYLAAAKIDHSGQLQFQLARLYRRMGRPDLAEQAQRLSDEQRHNSRHAPLVPQSK